MKNTIKPFYLKIIISLFVFYSIIGFVVIPYLIQSNFTPIIQKHLNTQGYLNRVYFNPFTFEIELHKLIIKDDQQENLLYFKSLYLNFNAAQLLFGEIKVDSLIIDSLKTTITIYKDKKFNFSHILSQLEQNKKDSIEEETNNNESVLFTLDTFLLKNTKIVFIDETKSENFTLKTNPFNFKIENFSTKPEQLISLQTNINVVNTLQLNLQSNIKLNPVDVNGKLLVQNIQLPTIYKYLKDDLQFQFAGVVNTFATSFDIKIINEKIKYLLKPIQVTSKSIDFIDLQKDANKVFNFTNLSVNVDQFSSEKNEKSTIDFKVNTPSSGSIASNAEIILEPFTVVSTLNIDDLTISPYKEYIKDFINLDVKSTTIKTNTTIKLIKDKQNVNSNITISDVDVFHNLSNKRLLKLKILDVKNLQYTNNNLFIENVLLDNFNTTVKIDKDKNTNIDHLTKETKKSENKNVDNNTSTPSKQKSVFHYHIKNLQLTNGKAEFSDHSLPLNFDTNIHNLNANISDLSSKNKETNIKINGIVEKYGLANIKATTLLSNFKDKTDVSINFENLDVRSFSPYSGKFIGQKIQDGRLWLDLNYHIKKSQLSSTNSVKLKNLTLGDDVKSEDALSLPVGLAIALLEDSEGLIQVDIPVHGDMENPQFELGGLIWKTVGNVLRNIVTAPFKFLGSLLGGDENQDLGIINFKFGSSEILQPQKEKLDKLLDLLKQKKNLILAVLPTYNVLNDAQILQEKKFDLLINSKDKEKTLYSLFIQKFTQKVFDDIQKKTKKEEFNSVLSQKFKKSLIINNKELFQLAKLRAKNLQSYFISHDLALERIKIKKDIFENKENNTKELSINLELNIKE